MIAAPRRLPRPALRLSRSAASLPPTSPTTAAGAAYGLLSILSPGCCPWPPVPPTRVSAEYRGAFCRLARHPNGRNLRRGRRRRHYENRRPPGGSALGLEQRADAVRCAAQALPQLLQARGVRHVEDDAVVVGELLAGLDGADRLDQHLVVARIAVGAFLHHRATVRRAAVVDPARAVAVAVGVDDVVVVEREQEGVAGLAAVAVHVVGLGVGHQRALVLDDFLALFDRGDGEHAIAVDGGTAGDDATGHGNRYRWGTRHDACSPCRWKPPGGLGDGCHPCVRH